MCIRDSNYMMNESKYDRKVCGEIQIIFHIFIAFAIGFYFGVSFVSETATLEASVVSYAMLQKSMMIGNISNFFNKRNCR